MDGGAQSPKETWLRLLLIDEGFPRPRTQIRATDGLNEAFIDMGWEEPMIGLEYDGTLHQTSRRRFVHDIGRSELVRRRGWLDLHVVAEHTRAFNRAPRYRRVCATRNSTSIAARVVKTKKSRP